ncbi:hypothetical protein [Candidatus Uabimicrobium amorphum]|uniref:Uncharacterized protein n=1 Tax=Uabimicrobium amorphum TaxID=2596890 RepID=A0A5S9F4M0_UABAM|nr:hypothetical protein [Candidatus Uabimicrobium amorphum]BBM85411.1 hypothetical protein UABAM_03778 [Candidatus Uabimicrobium amorphum]
MRLFYLCLLFIFASVSTYTQDIEYYTPEAQEDTLTTQDYGLEQISSQGNNDSVFKWAWEKSHYGYDYAIARQGGWTDPSSAGNAVIGVFGTRHEKDGDSRAITGYVAFRPFLLDYQTYSIAFGFSYVGTLQNFYEPTNNVNDEDFGGVIADLEAQDIDVFLNYQAFNFSVLGSFPQIGVQFTFEIGYLLSNLRASIEDIRVQDSDFNGALFDLNLQNYNFNQRDHSLYVSFEIRKLFERNYFNIVSLFLYSNINLNSERRNSSANVDLTILGANDQLDDKVQDLTNVVDVNLGNIGNIDPEDETLDVTYLGAYFSSRLINIPFGWEAIGDQSGIAIESIAGIEYGYGEFLGADAHGAALQMGGQITFFEFAILSFVHTWHQSNDFEDEWNITFAVGLYGAVSPSSTRVGPSVQGF